MKSEELNLMIKEGEGLTIEFKQKYTPRIDEDIVAFSNTKGGTLLLGVCDDGSVAGERLTNDLKAKINSLARNCKPSITVSMKQMDRLVAIDVPEGIEKPYSCGSGYFRRLNGTSQKMNHDELRIMFRESDIFPYEEKTARKFTLSAISKSKIRSFTREAGIDLGSVEAADFLRSLKVADGSSVKNAGILFFAKNVGKYLPQARTTLLAFKGTEKIHIYDRQDVQDDLLTQFNEAIRFIQRHINVRSEIKGVNRKDIYEIPLEAIREAVVNALMHRDYSITGTQINVEIYDDRVEIINPGGLFGGMLKKSLGTISVRRNEIVSDLFSRIHKVERVGMGIKRMRRVLLEAGLKEPEFDTNGFFRVVIHRSPEFALKATGRQPRLQKKLQTESSTRSAPAMHQVGTKSALSRHQVEILEKCREDTSLVNLMAVAKRSDRTKFRNGILKPLIEAGLLEFTIPDKPNSRLQKYRLTSKGRRQVEIKEDIKSKERG